MIKYKKIRKCVSAGCTNTVDEGVFCNICIKEKEQKHKEITIHQKNAISARIEELKSRLKKLKKNTFYKTFALLSELFENEKKLNPDYSIRQLALDNDMEESNVYRIMTFRHANDFTKKLVKENKIDESKVCRLLSFSYGRKNQETLIRECIEKKYTYDEIEELATRKRDVLIKERHIKFNHNIVRDIGIYCDKIESVLNETNINNIPKSKKDDVLNKLRTTKKIIEIGIFNLEEVKK